MLETARLNIVEARESDIPTIIALEEHPENRDYIWIGTREEHRNEIHDPDHLLLLCREKSDDRLIGYCLIHLNRKSEVFELRRIAMDEKHHGYGRETLAELIRFAFEDLGINRFWLDVYPDNEIGIRLYESMGMHRDGVLRQNYKAERGYLDQIVYSILRSEYFARKG